MTGVRVRPVTKTRPAELAVGDRLHLQPFPGATVAQFFGTVTRLETETPTDKHGRPTIRVHFLDHSGVERYRTIALVADVWVED